VGLRPVDPAAVALCPLARIDYQIANIGCVNG
jgi:hypothetical protein